MTVYSGMLGTATFSNISQMSTKKHPHVLYLPDIRINIRFLVHSYGVPMRNIRPENEGTTSRIFGARVPQPKFFKFANFEYLY